ncbi:sodium:solute symporter family transporter [Gordonia phthalatica]|uniref:sodium:solute symporter family transporter n=1 Tax=Gordonia phthalatica TaxID=1136941 RepID=UPI000ACEE424|nr:sodium:solute symporter [Gordonia phthalatica]
MSSQALIVTVTVIYLGLMIGIGLWAKRRMNSAKEFLVAGQSLGFFVMAIASFSSIQSGWGMVGATGATASWGIGGLAVGILAPLGFALTWFLLGGKLRRLAHAHDAYSIPDLVKVRYGNGPASLWMSIALIIGAIGYMTAQVVAAGVITALLLGLSFTHALIIGAIIVAAYTVAGGMLAAVWTDLVQGLLMIAMSVFVFFLAIGVGGGWSSTLSGISEANPEFLQLDGVKPAVWWVANALMIAFGMIGQPQLIHKFLMLRSPRELRWGALVAALGYGITTLFSIGIGFAARGQIEAGLMAKPEAADDTTTAFLDQFASPIVTALALTALLAAIMSSASSFITIGASAMTRDLLGAFGREITNELRWNRIASIVITAAAVGVALFLDQIIYLLGAIGWSAFAAATLGPIVLGLYWRRGTSRGATVAISGSLILNIVLVLADRYEWWTPPSHFFTGFTVIVAGVVLYVVASLLTPSDEDVRRFDTVIPSGFPVPAAATTSAAAAAADRAAVLADNSGETR